MAGNCSAHLSLEFERWHYKSIGVSQDNVWNYATRKEIHIPILFLRLMLILVYICYADNSVDAYLLRLLLLHL